MLRQADRQAVTVELTILLVQTSWQCDSSIYAKAGRQAATVELTILLVQTSGTVTLAFMLRQAGRLLMWNSQYC
jgi:hypothetical protein